MAKPTKRPVARKPRGAPEPAPTGRGRATPKVSAAAGGRYTAPIPRTEKVSPRWVPVLMFALLAVGALMIMANYIGLLPGGEASNVYLFAGLGLILAGIITSTQYH
jgi:hypothetical protein